MHPPRVTRSPKRSLTVRFPVPRAAAKILRSMAMSKDPRLLELGVLAVKFKDNENIALGLDVEKEPWEKNEGLQEPVQHSSTSEILSHFNSAGVVFPSNPERNNTAGKHSTQDVIYAGNGLSAAEKKISRLLRIDASGGGSSSETRSSVLRPSFSHEEIAPEQASSVQSEPTLNNQSNLSPGRILAPLPRQTKREESASPGTRPMLDIFFDQGRFSAANMLMRLAKNHTSKEESAEQQEEHSTADSDKPVVMTNISTNYSNKTSIVSQESPNKIAAQSQEVTMELKEDEVTDSSGNVESPPVMLWNSTKSSSTRTNPIHFEQNKPDIASKSRLIHGSVSQASAGNDCSRVHSTLSTTTWSGRHSSLDNSRTTQSHMDSTSAAQTVYPPVLSNAWGVHSSLDQMPKGSADTKTTWSNPSVRPHSQSNSNAQSSSDAQPTSSDPSVSSNSLTDGQADTGHGESTLMTWSSNSAIPSSNTVNMQPQLGLYQQNIAQYPVSYVTYPLGFVYPYITLPQGVNTVNSQESKDKDGAEKQERKPEVKPVKPPDESVVNDTKQEHDSSTRVSSKNTSTVQWVIPQVQAGNVVQQGQFIDLASSLRYWQQLSLLYRSHLQAAAEQALAGNLQYTASSTSTVTSSTVTGHFQLDKSQESHDFNNNLTVGGDKSAGNEVSESQVEVIAGTKCENSLSSLKQLSSDPRPVKSHTVNKSNSNPGRASVIHVVEPNESNKALESCTVSPSSDHCLWTRTTISSEKPGRTEEWSGSSSTVTSSSDDNSSPAPDKKGLFHPVSTAQKPPLKCEDSHGLLKGTEQGPAPQLSFVHENSIAYMNVRSHCDYGMKELKKSASRSEEGVHPTKRKKSKKSL